MIPNAKKMVSKALKALEISDRYAWLLELEGDENWHFRQAVFHLSQIIASMQKREALPNQEDKEVA